MEPVLDLDVLVAKELSRLEEEFPKDPLELDSPDKLRLLEAEVSNLRKLNATLTKRNLELQKICAKQAGELRSQRNKREGFKRASLVKEPKILLPPGARKLRTIQPKLPLPPKQVILGPPPTVHTVLNFPFKMPLDVHQENLAPVGLREVHRRNQEVLPLTKLRKVEQEEQPSTNAVVTIDWKSPPKFSH